MSAFPWRSVAVWWFSLPVMLAVGAGGERGGAHPVWVESSDSGTDEQMAWLISTYGRLVRVWPATHTRR